ncbi:membrane protein [Endozoicomonas numazuensis]|uniref:Membrane protein n=2 Tax=Endozoicomonas numazuensis TaxID=1137799 RepID=A0A081NGM3_9GAMM|nr:membrane protein [Endozoicomonas numazuensis]
MLQRLQRNMARPQKKTDSSKTREEAMATAKATQRPGQSKEQTRLIAQGIQKGIEHYKKQQKAKARELDKNLKKVRKQTESPVQEAEAVTEEVIHYKQHWLPWLLLGLSWGAFVLYLMTSGT